MFSSHWYISRISQKKKKKKIRKCSKLWDRIIIYYISVTKRCNEVRDTGRQKCIKKVLCKVVFMVNSAWASREWTTAIYFAICIIGLRQNRRYSNNTLWKIENQYFSEISVDKIRGKYLLCVQYDIIQNIILYHFFRSMTVTQHTITWKCILYNFIVCALW